MTTISKPVDTPGWLTAVAAVVAAAAAAVSGLAVLEDSSVMVYLPLLAAVALTLGVLALTRFAALVYLLLGVRTSIDLFKLSGAAAGSTENNSISSRGLDPSTLIGVLFIVAAILWLTAQYARNGRLPGSRLRTAWLVFIAACILSIPRAETPLVSAIGLLRILAVALMFMVLEQLMTDRAAVKRALIAAFVSLAFPLAYTLYGFLLGSPAADIKSSYTRITGPFGQSTTFARYLGFFIIFGFALLPHVKGKARWLLAGSLGLSGVFLTLTLTRGAIFGTVLALVLVVVLQRRWSTLAALVAAGLIALVLVPGLSDRLGSAAAEREVGTGPTGNSLEWRFEYWTETIPLASSSPVNGIGLEMTQYKTEDAKQPHNDFIRAYVETGLFGLAAYSFLVWQFISVGVRAIRGTRPRTMDRGIAVGYACCALAFVLESVAANVISSVVVLWYLVVFAAAAAAVTRFNAPGPPGGHLTGAPGSRLSPQRTSTIPATTLAES